MLGELGADVVRSNSQSRVIRAVMHSQDRKSKRYLNVVNGCKRSITLDLSKEAGQALAHRLIANADVVIEFLPVLACPPSPRSTTTQPKR